MEVCVIIIDVLCIIFGLGFSYYKRDTTYYLLGLLLAGFGVGGILQFFDLLKF